MQAPAVRFRVDFGHGGAVGPGKIALLEHVATGGSLSQAARELGMSYRRAWQLLESLNSSFRERVVVSAKGGRGGGGARLTPFGRLLIRVYHEFDAEIQKRALRAFRPVTGLARQSARGTAPIVRLTARRTGRRDTGRTGQSRH